MVNTFISGSGTIGSNAGKECQSFFDCLHIALLFSGKAIAKKIETGFHTNIIESNQNLTKNFL